jgi:hypothetical protein
MNPENFSVEELEKLKKSSFWFNEKKCTDAFLQSLKLDLLNKAQRPYIFNETHKKIQPLLLLEQFCSAKPGDLLLHNIEDKKEVLHWTPHQCIESLFEPIHYQIFVKKNPPPLPQSLTSSKSIQNLFDFQSILISSVFVLTHFSLNDIISNLEVFLDCTLTEFFVFCEKIIFLFEWKEAMECVLLVSFTTPSLDNMKNNEYLQFERNALFEDILQEEKTNERVSLIRESLKTTKLAYH